ncbi:type II toxin-antitoxin system RelE/ParE family toxin [Aquiflexum sp.]|uniref:type II toxin-antitoxin system RelE/ParE family toxin n=1 Tax=Aquiflexum sp. TaxID=1872584 RepID=UPI0035946E85
MKVIWSEFAENQLDEIFDYYAKESSLSIAAKHIRQIIKVPNKLKRTPFIGQVEEFLKERPIIYRYLVFKNYKIIYSVDEKNKLIKIADVFDTRQNPSKIKRSK